MKKFLTTALAIVIVLAGAGAALVHFHVVALPGHKNPHPTVIALTTANSTLVTEPNITSNLSTTGHFIQVTVGFRVSKKALIKHGGKVGTTSGTGSAALDDEIDTDIMLLCRQTPYSAFSTAADVRHFRERLNSLLSQIFGAHQVGAVYLPSLLTQ